MKFFLMILLVILACLTASSSAKVSCRERYTCTQAEFCLNGWCVERDLDVGGNGMQERRHVETSRYQKIRKTSGAYSCRKSKDCDRMGFGYSCIQRECRQLF